jgi:dUTP pyrophosphatase
MTERRGMMKLKVMRIHPNAILPEYAHPGDAGLDLFSIEEAVLSPGDSKLIRTGIKIELPKGTEAQIRPRSGLALKHQITILNTPGTVDEGYRGEIGVIIINHGKADFQVKKGMKIAQMVIKPVLHVEIEEVSRLTNSQRGEGGFGSSGILGKNSD